MSIEETKVNINLMQFLRGIRYSVLGITELSNVHLKFDIDPTMIVLHVEQLKVQRVTLNLLTNSIKHSDNNDVSLKIRTFSDCADLVEEVFE